MTNPGAKRSRKRSKIVQLGFKGSSQHLEIEELRWQELGADRRIMRYDRRLFGLIGNIPPAEFEAVYYANNEAPALMVGLT
jgi:hypothetical protein